jgi:hypothetical protein
MGIIVGRFRTPLNSLRTMSVQADMTTTRAAKSRMSPRAAPRVLERPVVDRAQRRLQTAREDRFDCETVIHLESRDALIERVQGIGS